MEQNKDFTDLLFQAIIERQQMFDSFLLPKLHEEYRITQSATRTIKTLLVKKGSLLDDPYKYDNKTTELLIPSEESFGENEKSSVMGTRLAQYEAMLDVIINYYQFTCDYLTTDRINKLVALNRSFAWEQFSNTSTRPNIKALAELVNAAKSGADALSVSIINDTVSQLAKSSIAITKALKSLTEFHRERYKTAVRKMVMPSVVINTATLETGNSAALREIKKSFAVNMKDQPFYTELIEEIIREDYSPEHAVLQQELLTRLTSMKQDNAKAAVEESLKPLLMDGIRTLGGIAQPLTDIASKLGENNQAILSVEKTFFQKLKEILRKAFNRPEEEQEMTITTVDPVTQTGKKEIIKFTAFTEDIKRRARICNGFGARNSMSYQKVETMDEQQILDLLTRQIAELNVLVKQCVGLDEYFKQVAPPEVRNQVHGIKIEISSIKNNLVKANQCRAEYASQVEEQQQMKKLGITNA
jgi:hypothetical protein